MSYLNLASIRRCTESEGPGKRFALWVQGCRRRCPGCCNPEMQPLVQKKIVDVIDVISLIGQARDEYQIEGVSFIGGEPVLQAEGLADLAFWCHENALSVLMFTGFLYQELLDMHHPDVDRLLKSIDLLVDGPFHEEELDDVRPWIGSKNQKVWFLTDRYTTGIEYSNGQHSMEIMISEKNIRINGWPFGV